MIEKQTWLDLLQLVSLPCALVIIITMYQAGYPGVALLIACTLLTLTYVKWLCDYQSLQSCWRMYLDQLQYTNRIRDSYRCKWEAALRYQARKH